MVESITADMLATQPLRELEFTVLPETELGLLPRVLLLPYGASAVGFAPGGELGTVVIYRATGMPGVTRWLVNGDTLRARSGSDAFGAGGAGGRVRGG